MTTEIVVATRSGLVSGPDGTKFRLVRGKTLADARHPIAEQFPELFAAHTIDLPIERGVVDADNLPTHVGWLADAVFEALDRELNPVAPPTPPRRGRPRKQQD
jgi:hypothetical protein